MTAGPGGGRGDPVRRRAAEAGEAALRLVAGAVGDGAGALKRRMAAPWREGREGPAAEAGRWIGVGLAVGAFVAGVAAALYAARRE